MGFAMRNAWREIRNNRAFSLFYIVNLALGLIGFISVDSFKQSLDQRVEAESKELLGADLAIRARREITQEELTAVRDTLPDGTQEIEAVDFLDQVCERPQLQTKFTMQKGEILFLNNWTLLHRRTAFTDFPEPLKQRHLLRVWLSMPNSRPLDGSFKENFGSTLAGAIRGGMLRNSG